MNKRNRIAIASLNWCGNGQGLNQKCGARQLSASENFIINMQAAMKVIHHCLVFLPERLSSLCMLLIQGLTIKNSLTNWENTGWVRFAFISKSFLIWTSTLWKKSVKCQSNYINENPEFTLPAAIGLWCIVIPDRSEESLKIKAINEVRLWKIICYSPGFR